MLETLYQKYAWKYVLLCRASTCRKQRGNLGPLSRWSSAKTGPAVGLGNLAPLASICSHETYTVLP